MLVLVETCAVRFLVVQNQAAIVVTLTFPSRSASETTVGLRVTCVQRSEVDAVGPLFVRLLYNAISLERDRCIGEG